MKPILLQAVCGNEVEVYFDGRTAFAAMREAGLAAQREILLESYIFKDDATGHLFLDEIKAAAASAAGP